MATMGGLVTGGRNLGEKWVAKDGDCQGNGGERLWCGVQSLWVGLFGGTVVWMNLWSVAVVCD